MTMLEQMIKICQKVEFPLSLRAGACRRRPQRLLKSQA